jgi:hypothetical protein
MLSSSSEAFEALIDPLDKLPRDNLPQAFGPRFVAAAFSVYHMQHS